MGVQLKSIDQQTMVITGATSGIGLVTARMAAQHGARLVLAARNKEALWQLTAELNAAGGAASYVVADVARLEDVQQIAACAMERFGGFDTWVNNAGVSIYGRLMDVSDEDHRQLFETNFWGLVNGARVAVEHLRQRGGALINVGSALSDRAIPLQGMYCASKHAVKGFTDALRMELEEEGAPISVTLVKPAAIDTPYKDHAKNYLPNEPNNPPPVYAPEVVAKAILHCAQHPTRDVFAGGGGKLLATFGARTPRLLDKLMELAIFKLQQQDIPERNRATHGLYEAKSDLRERGGYNGHVAESSVYTKASLHPVTSAAIAAGAGLAVAALLHPALAGKTRRKAKSFWS